MFPIQKHGGTGTEPPAAPAATRAVLVDQGDDCRRSIESGIRSPCRPEPRTTTFIIFSPPGTIRRRVPVAVKVRREKKSEFVAKLEEVLPLLRERFGVARIGIFGSAARGEERRGRAGRVCARQMAFRNFRGPAAGRRWERPPGAADGCLTDRGPAVIAGCAHPGICSTIVQARAVTGEERVADVISNGQTHCASGG